MSRLRDSLAATAQPQTSSPFFNDLPCEIRQKIYQHLWDLYDTRWHVHSFGNQVVPVFPCNTHSGEDDVRIRTHVPAALLVCKQMYLESVDELESVLTFCFTDIIVARDFLVKHAPSRNIRNIDISLRVKPLITELYFPGPDGKLQPHISGLSVTSKKNPWEDLCRRLSMLPSLRSLHLRLDSEDLRPWHKRVNEKAFFKQLSHAKAREFVLYLPDLPEHPELQGLPGCYLDSDVSDDGGAPFTVKRGPRPNNWQLHLSRISHTLPENWSHSLWNQVRDKVWAA
ncbi:hypothetical protein M406DRAFT_350915 [Cryphonectria parasitica EP155]|uniref:DUF7730 domain-containing protein n=1 Tax=Cryphonectria parasitica (strain ATCC 38755 / EP155) TaxID=660469 RepID=A0A9P4Y866_CRYP1|nr:uncharacterized protein M406DRAFT_350915 [Cryphonectria parasitica EP155]KAF3768132.1 hypothetical protein M406DRAFT_350915 [Cryphonectria parasitica EP155]